MNTTTLEVPTQLYQEMQSLADAEQTDIIELLRRLLAGANGQRIEPQATTGAFQRILDRATDLGVTNAEHAIDIVDELYGSLGQGSWDEIEFDINTKWERFEQ